MLTCGKGKGTGKGKGKGTGKVPGHEGPEGE